MESGKMRILLTGATGGIGERLATSLVDAGAVVMIQGRNIDKLSAIVRVLGEENVIPVCADLRDDGDVKRLVKDATARNINVLINNAGITDFGLFEEAPVADIINTNVTAPMQLTQALLPHLSAQPEAMIVNIGSTFGSIGYPGYVTYCAAKHAMKGFSEALRRELSDSAIDVLYMSPRATATDMNRSAAVSANESLGVQEDTAVHVADVVVKAMQKNRPRVQFGTAERFQVKLNTLFPGVVDGAIARQLKTIKHFATMTEESSC